MRFKNKRSRIYLSAISIVAAGALAAACGSSSAGGASKTITLRIGTFGTFGYKEAGLYQAFEKAHPNIKVVEDNTELEQNYWTTLRTHIESHSGVDDIQAIEIGRISDVAGPMSSAFENLLPLGASKDVADFSKAKLGPAYTSSGALVALGTDLGPMGIAYRTDLLKKAGLPTDPATLGKDWSTWQDYLAMGLKYKGKVPGSAWMDDAGGLYNAIVNQSAEQYYNSSHQLVFSTNPAIKSAWNLSVQANSEGLSAKLNQFETPWNKGFASGAFATIAAPAWMIGYIKTQAGSAGSGKWNITTTPAPTGNWGGSYLAVPKGGKHTQQAFELLQFLTSAQSEAKVFKTVGNYPSNIQAQAMIGADNDPYFNGTAIGTFFATIAKTMPVVILGHNYDTLRSDAANALVAIETQGKSPSAEWKTVVQQIASDAAAQ